MHSASSSPHRASPCLTRYLILDSMINIVILVCEHGVMSLPKPALVLVHWYTSKLVHWYWYFGGVVRTPSKCHIDGLPCSFLCMQELERNKNTHEFNHPIRQDIFSLHQGTSHRATSQVPGKSTETWSTCYVHS